MRPSTRKAIVRGTLFAALLGNAACGGAHPSALNLPTPSPALSSGEPTIRVADAALLGGAPAMAVQVADGILARNPRDLPALLRKGEALYLLKRNDEAMAVFEHALAVNPGNAGALLGLGRIRLAHDPAAAADLFSQVLGREPRNAAALNDLGIARDLLGQHSMAQAAYRTALAVSPDTMAARVNLGVSLAVSGHEKEALDVLRPLAAAPETTPRMRQDVAATLALAGEDDAARNLLSQDLNASEIAQAMSSFKKFHNYTNPPNQ